MLETVVLTQTMLGRNYWLSWDKHSSYAVSGLMMTDWTVLITYSNSSVTSYFEFHIYSFIAMYWSYFMGPTYNKTGNV